MLLMNVTDYDNMTDDYNNSLSIKKNWLYLKIILT